MAHNSLYIKYKTAPIVKKNREIEKAILNG